MESKLPFAPEEVKDVFDRMAGVRIRTWSGISFCPFFPEPDKIAVVDIAHALSHQCRFTGHTDMFYSVAQHCVHVSELCAPEHALSGLLHDASEAYLSDIAKPVKPFLQNYEAIENNLMTALARKFQFDWPLPFEVHTIDQALQAAEARDLMSGAKFPDLPPPPAGFVITPWSPVQARARFMQRFFELTAEPTAEVTTLAS